MTRAMNRTMNRTTSLETHDKTVQTPERLTPQTMQRLRATQGIAGGLFSLFLLVHLANFYLAPFGLEAYNGFQQLARTVYQYPLVELLVVALPVLTHIICGLWLIVLKRRVTGKMTMSWQTVAGLFLSLVIVGHVVAVRGPSLLYGVYPGFEGLSFSLWYFPAYFYPYYFLLALAGFYHMMTGFARLGSRYQLVAAGSVPSALTVVVAIWTLVSLLALDGQLFEVPVPSASAFAKLGEELFGMDIHRPW